MAASCSYDTSANASPTNKEHLLTDLLDEIQNILEEAGELPAWTPYEDLVNTDFAAQAVR